MKIFAESPDKEATDLIEAHLNGMIDETHGKKLAQRLQAEPDFRAYYIDCMGLDAAMQREFEHFTDSSVDSSTPAGAPRSWLPWALASSAVAAAIAIAFSVNSSSPSTTVDNTKPAELKPLAEPAQPQLTSSIARLISENGAVWSGANDELQVGSWLKPGVYHLKFGSAFLELDSGATISLSEKTRIELYSNNKGKLINGEIVAQIPVYNRDFQIELPNGLVTEEAQKFAVRINSDQSTDVEAIEGSATLKRANKVVHTVLPSKNPIRIDSKGNTSSTPKFAKTKSKAPNKFITANYVHYRFDSVPADGFVRDHGNFNLPMNGQLLNASAEQAIIDGVFGNALYFSGELQRIETAYQGVRGNAARTVAFWVNIPDDVKSKDAFSIAAWGKNKTGQKWQIAWNNGRDGAKRKGAIRAEFGNGRAIGTTDLRDGNWHHISIVYPGGPAERIAQNIKFFVDGKIDPISFIKSAPIDTRTNDTQFIIGDRIDKPRVPHYNGFKGSIDELYVFEAALTPRQIRQLYKNNKAPNKNKFVPSVIVKK